MSEQNKSSLSYRDAGVDIDAGDRLVEAIKPLAASTHVGSGILAGIGGFGALYELPGGYRQPVLVSGTDGVGTKLKLAMSWQQHGGVGIDLVAMCVNDILVSGAKPLFFLDYYATGRLSVKLAEAVIAGIAQGCRQAGAALIGGETAEMPGFYQGEEYDLAGFCVGIVEKDQIIDGSRIQPGHILLALASSGPHSNGYSLIRKIVERSAGRPDDPLEGSTLKQCLLEPTRIYVKPVLSLLEQLPIYGMAHITGGGLLENIPRVFPDGAQAVIERASWTMPAVFQWLQQQGAVADEEMLRTFNCGVGMVLILDAENTRKSIEHFAAHGIHAWRIGQVSAGRSDTVRLA